MPSNEQEIDLPDPKVRGLVWCILQVICQNLFCFWLGFRASGNRRLEDSDGGLIVSNHQSFLDPLLIGLPFQRPVSFLARDSLFRIPMIGWILRKTHVMPINRDGASTVSLRETIRRLQRGYLVGIFPEGTRSETGAVGRFKPGFVAILRRGNRPLFPVGVSGAFQALNRRSWFLKPTRVRVVFGSPIGVEVLALYAGRDQEEALIEFVRSRVVECYQAAETWRMTGIPPSEWIESTVSKTRVDSPIQNHSD